MDLSESAAQLVRGASSRIRRRHGDARSGLVGHVLVGVLRQSRGEARGSPRGLFSWTRDHSRYNQRSSRQSSHRLMRMVSWGTIPSKTPALRRRVLWVRGVIIAVVAPDAWVLALHSASLRGDQVWACEGGVWEETSLIRGLPRRRGSCTCTWGSLWGSLWGSWCCRGLWCCRGP